MEMEENIATIVRKENVGDCLDGLREKLEEKEDELREIKLRYER